MAEEATDARARASRAEVTEAKEFKEEEEVVVVLLDSTPPTTGAATFRVELLSTMRTSSVVEPV